MFGSRIQSNRVAYACGAMLLAVLTVSSEEVRNQDDSTAARRQMGDSSVVFEVASIKPAATSSSPSYPGLRLPSQRIESGYARWWNASVLDLIMFAYHVRERQIIGPAWLGSLRYDVSAKIPASADRWQIPAMLQALLADRFKLVVRTEKRDLSVYVLLAGKDRSKLKEVGTARPVRVELGPTTRRFSGTVSLATLATMLSNQFDRPVVDMTGIAGTFDIDLAWATNGSDVNPLEQWGFMDALRARAGPGRLVDSTAAAVPPIVGAVHEQLGLNLDARQMPHDVLVVERIEKTPTEN